MVTLRSVEASKKRKEKKLAPQINETIVVKNINTTINIIVLKNCNQTFQSNPWIKFPDNSSWDFTINILLLDCYSNLCYKTGEKKVEEIFLNLAIHAHTQWTIQFVPPYNICSHQKISWLNHFRPSQSTTCFIFFHS